jgi:putative ABC transport system ATP-binding protein
MEDSKNITISVEEVMKSFMVGTQEINVLKGVTFHIFEGEFVVIFGPSGSGKSTLLHTILGLESPSSGTVRFHDEDIYTNRDDDDRAVFRKNHIGMIYQQPNWIKSFNVVENVAFPLMLQGMEKSVALTRAMEQLRSVEMDSKARYRPTELSGGQQQRVAMARALINNPYVIIADEPTGNLDFESGQMVMQLLADLNTKKKKTVIMVTHDLEYISYAQKAVRIFDGKVVGVYEHKDKADLEKELKHKRTNNIESFMQETANV